MRKSHSKTLRLDEGTRAAWLWDDGFTEAGGHRLPTLPSGCFDLLPHSKPQKNISLSCAKDPSIAALNRSARTAARSGWPASCQGLCLKLPGSTAAQLKCLPPVPPVLLPRFP